MFTPLLVGQIFLLVLLQPPAVVVVVTKKQICKKKIVVYFCPHFSFGFYLEGDFVMNFSPRGASC